MAITDPDLGWCNCVEFGSVENYRERMYTFETP